MEVESEVRKDVILLIEWRDRKKSLIVLALINLFFTIVCLLNISVLALALLFVVFLSGLGTALHLIYMSTSDEYRDKLNSTEK